jgi:hypothetical protein
MTVSQEDMLEVARLVRNPRFANIWMLLNDYVSTYPLESLAGEEFSKRTEPSESTAEDPQELEMRITTAMKKPTKMRRSLSGCVGSSEVAEPNSGIQPESPRDDSEERAGALPLSTYIENWYQQKLLQRTSADDGIPNDSNETLNFLQRTSTNDEVPNDFNETLPSEERPIINSEVAPPNSGNQPESPGDVSEERAGASPFTPYKEEWIVRYQKFLRRTSTNDGIPNDFNETSKSSEERFITNPNQHWGKRMRSL